MLEMDEEACLMDVGLGRPVVAIQRLPIRFESDDSRVIALPFFPDGGPRVRRILERIDELSEEGVVRLLRHVVVSHSDRHPDVEAIFDEHFQTAVDISQWGGEWSLDRRRLAGAFLTMEYAIESAALFNPSIVAHPDQTGLPPEDCRFIMSLRATGEGHVSSIVFRTGVIDSMHDVHIEPPARILHRSRISPERLFVRDLFGRKLSDLGTDTGIRERILGKLAEKFTLLDLHHCLDEVRCEARDLPGLQDGVDAALWLAQSNYHIDLDAEADISELVIYPMSEVESHGIEDLRMVRFVEDDGEVTYYGTYTAYNGVRTMPMLISTKDFRRIDVCSLNGACAINKGMALFPRRVGGHYVMCSRIDAENLYISYSDYVHFWESAERIEYQSTTWELVQMGNCGSPIETPEGWLLLTHGVGPLRTYSIGALLLDLEDPTKVIGQLDEPLLVPIGEEREGYVPNVVYTCGAMVHGERLYLPYALADKSTRFANPVTQRASGSASELASDNRLLAGPGSPSRARSKFNGIPDTACTLLQPIWTLGNHSRHEQVPQPVAKLTPGDPACLSASSGASSV